MIIVTINERDRFLLNRDKKRLIFGEYQCYRGKFANCKPLIISQKAAPVEGDFSQFLRNPSGMDEGDWMVNGNKLAKLSGVWTIFQLDLNRWWFFHASHTNNDEQ